MQIQLYRLIVYDRLLMSCISSNEIFFLYRLSEGGFVDSFISNADKVLSEKYNDTIILLINC